MAALSTKPEAVAKAFEVAGVDINVLGNLTKNGNSPWTFSVRQAECLKLVPHIKGETAPTILVTDIERFVKEQGGSLQPSQRIKFLEGVDVSPVANAIERETITKGEKGKPSSSKAKRSQTHNRASQAASEVFTVTKEQWAALQFIINEDAEYYQMALEKGLDAMKQKALQAELDRIEQEAQKAREEAMKRIEAEYTRKMQQAQQEPQQQDSSDREAKALQAIAAAKK